MPAPPKKSVPSSLPVMASAPAFPVPLVWVTFGNSASVTPAKLIVSGPALPVTWMLVALAHESDVAVPFTSATPPSQVITADSPPVPSR